MSSSTTSDRIFSGACGNRLVATRRLAPTWHSQGQAVALLLHGGGQTRHAWDGTARALAVTGWQSVALDQRGHGDSAWIEDGAYSFADFGADALVVGRAITAETGVKPVAVGASLGGLASLLALAESVSDPVFSALVLVDIVPQMDPRGVDHIKGFMRAHAAEGFASVEAAADAIAAYLPHRPRPRSLAGLSKNLRLQADGRFRWHWDPRFLDGPRPVAADWDIMAGKLDAVTRAMPVPSLLVRGASSELVTEAAAEAFLALSPTTQYANISEARHMVAGDKNDAFAEAVVGFLAQIRG